MFFETHGCTTMFTFTQNQSCLLWFSWGKLHMDLKLRKSEIERCKQFTIRSWNKGDMATWSKFVQRVCCNKIAYESNTFCLFRLIFWATCWPWKLLNCCRYRGASFGKFWCQILLLSWRQLALVHNWKVVKIIPWPCDLFLNISFLWILLYCMRWKVFFKKFLILVFLMKSKFSWEGWFQT